LSYLEAREYETIEQRVADAEEVLQAKRTQLEDPRIVSDGERLIAAHARWKRLRKKWIRSTPAGLIWRKRKGEIREQPCGNDIRIFWVRMRGKKR